MKPSMGGDEGTDGGEVFVDVEDVAVEVPEVEAVATALFSYSSSREPAPQYSYGLPGQIKLQSVRA